MEAPLFTNSVYTENRVTLLHQISMIFSRRCLNIDSMTVSACSIEGVHKFTITCRSTRPMMEHVVKQLEKRIDVIKAFLLTDDEILFQEVALYKVPTENVVNTDIEEIDLHGGEHPRRHRLAVGPRLVVPQPLEGVAHRVAEV